LIDSDMILCIDIQCWSWNMSVCHGSRCNGETSCHMCSVLSSISWWQPYSAVTHHCCIM